MSDKRRRLDLGARRFEHGGMFRSLSDHVLVSPQLSIADVARAQGEGVSLIVNNRPDGESPDQTPGEVIAAAAEAAGLRYAAIPVTGGFAAGQVEALRRLLDEVEGMALLYCRSGTRSALLWALAEAAAGAEPDDVATALDRAGYDAGPVRPALDALAARAGSGG